MYGLDGFTGRTDKFAMPRPTTDPKAERLEMRVSADFIAKLDDWRRQQPDLPPRAEAIRRLVLIGMAHRGEASPPAAGRTLYDLFVQLFTEEPDAYNWMGYQDRLPGTHEDFAGGEVREMINFPMRSAYEGLEDAAATSPTAAAIRALLRPLVEGVPPEPPKRRRARRKPVERP